MLSGNESGFGAAMAGLNQLFLYPAGALGLIIYLLLIKEKKYWDSFEILLGGLQACLLPFSKSILESSVKGETDDVSLYIFRLGLLTNVAIGLVVLLTKKSPDPTVQSSVLISNILSRGMIIMCSVYGCLFLKILPKEMMYFDLFYMGLLVLGNFAHLRKVSRKEGGLNFASEISTNLAFDAVTTFFLGALALGFPALFFDLLVPEQSIAGVHNTVISSLGALLLGGSVLSFASLCFKNEMDGVAVLKSKLVIYLPALQMAMYNHYIGSLTSIGHTVMMIVQTILILNVVVAWTAVSSTKSKED